MNGLAYDVVVTDAWDTTVFSVVESAPSFPGGMDQLRNFIKNNLQYPQQARQNNIHGDVCAYFVAEKDGSLSKIKILRDLGYGCGQETLRLVRSMPKFIPAKIKGKTVRCQYVLPIVFSAEDNQ